MTAYDTRSLRSSRRASNSPVDTAHWTRTRSVESSSLDLCRPALMSHVSSPFSVLQDDAWEAKLATIFKFIHQIISILYHRVESSETCLRLFLLAAQVADEAGLEELAYEFFVQAFVIYEESISESRAQLQAITIIIRTLQRARVFGSDNYDTLITKAALHGNRLLKKPQQANAVLYASHLWWQNEIPGRSGRKDNVSISPVRCAWLSMLSLPLSLPLTFLFSFVDACRRCFVTRSGCSSVCRSRSKLPARASRRSSQSTSTASRSTRFARPPPPSSWYLTRPYLTCTLRLLSVPVLL